MSDPRRAGLVAEAERYLAAVAIFRTEGCEPHWQREPGTKRMLRRASTTTLLLGRNERRFT
jgi:hypothetical protein